MFEKVNMLAIIHGPFHNPHCHILNSTKNYVIFEITV